MPALNVNSHGIPAVETFSIYLQQLLDHAEAVKPTTEIDPAITNSDLDGVYGQIDSIFDFPQNDPKTRKYAIVETATRDVFGNLIVRCRTASLLLGSTSIPTRQLTFPPKNLGHHVH